MKKHHLFALWGGLFVLCAALGFIQNPSNALRALMRILSVAFFIPGGLLLRHSHQTGDKEPAMLVRNFSAASLALTAILLIANFLCVLAPVWLGNFLHSILIIVSTPIESVPLGLSDDRRDQNSKSKKEPLRAASYRDLYAPNRFFFPNTAAKCHGRRQPCRGFLSCLVKKTLVLECFAVLNRRFFFSAVTGDRRNTWLYSKGSGGGSYRGKDSFKTV